MNRHNPYTWLSIRSAATLSGQVDFNIDNLATAAPNIRAGKLKALAVTTMTRSSALPEVPPMADTLKGFAVDTWWGLVAPVATPKEIIARLNQAFVAALNAPETRIRFASLMAEPVPTTPEAFGDFMKGELAKYERVVKASGARVD
ncbi:MAG: tripartite tricarboxylate transporter substrate-binding protein [Burkholderiaceae bacterium]